MKRNETSIVTSDVTVSTAATTATRTARTSTGRHRRPSDDTARPTHRRVRASMIFLTQFVGVVLAALSVARLVTGTQPIVISAILLVFAVVFVVVPARLERPEPPEEPDAQGWAPAHAKRSRRAAGQVQSIDLIARLEAHPPASVVRF